MIITAEGKFLVRIKRATFAKNPNAGITVSHVEGNSALQATLSYNGNLANVLGKEFRLFETFPILEIDEQTVTIAFTFPAIGLDCLKKKIREHPEAGLELRTIKKTMDLHSISHPPLPDYLFEYEKDMVQCSKCNSVFYHCYLESDCNDCGPIMRVCPVCDEPHCCEVEYEDPHKVARELGVR